MQRQIQVHFDNRAQLDWIEDIDDVEQWITQKGSGNHIFINHAESGRHMLIPLSKVTAIIFVDCPNNGDFDASQEV